MERTEFNNPRHSFPGIQLFITLAVFLICCTSTVVSGETRKNVLILNSYHQGYKWSDDETHGILSALEPVKDSTRFYIEYMGMKWMSGEHYFQQLRDLYRTKFSHVKFNTIIATDDDAFNFLVSYRNEIFGKIPVIFCGVNYFTDESLKGRLMFTGINETADIRESLDIALKLHPTTKEVALINDSSISGIKVHDEIMKITSAYSHEIRFLSLEGLDMATLLQSVQQLPSDAIIFYTFYSGGKNDPFYEFDESISLVSTYAKVPIYGAWDFNLGYGIVGGKLTSGYDQGRLAGEMALRVLNGEKPDNIPIIRRSPTRYMFDYRVMQRFGIKVSDLPKDSLIINEPVSFYQVNKNLVWGMVAGFFLLTFAVMMLLVNIRQRRDAEASLRDEIEERKLAQGELQKSRDELELRVQERTADLAEANQQLMCEIAERKQAEEMLRELSERDHLTKMFNRRKALEYLGAEIEKAKRYDRPLSIILFDVDHFKKINDTYGHDIGDLALSTTTEIIRSTVRKADICARYGGEEFIIVTPETGLDGASALAEKLRTAIENHDYTKVGKMTISAGVAEFMLGDSDTSFIKRADEALYNAKNMGRNRVEVARTNK